MTETRFEYLTGTVAFKPPTYRVTRTSRLVGTWPFRRIEYSYRAETEYSAMTMDAWAYQTFKEYFPNQIVEEFGE